MCFRLNRDQSDSSSHEKIGVKGNMSALNALDFPLDCQISAANLPLSKENA